MPSTCRSRCARPQVKANPLAATEREEKMFHKTLIGATGEYYVAALLSAMGVIVALPRGGVPSTDLLVTSENGKIALALQIKTGRRPYQKNIKQQRPYLMWDCSLKAIDNISNEKWYAFVSLNSWPVEESTPKVYFIPSKVVSERMKQQKKDKRKRPFYWVFEDEAQKYEGHAGLKLVIKELTKKD